MTLPKLISGSLYFLENFKGVIDKHNNWRHMGTKQLSLVKIIGPNLPNIEIKSFKYFLHTTPFRKVPHKTKSKKNKLLKMKVCECLIPKQ